MKYLIAIIALIVLNKIVFSLNSKLDSLWSEYNNAKHDSDRINILITKIAYEYENINPDSAILLYFKAINLNKKFDNKSKEAEVLKLIGIVNYYKGEYDSTIYYFKSSLAIFKELKSDKGIASCYNGLGNVYKELSDYTLALENFQHSLSIFEKINEKEGISHCYNNIGTVHVDLENYSTALDYYQKALNIYTELKNEKGISLCYVNIGVVYKFKNNYNKAIEYYHKAIIIKEKIGDKYGISYCYNNIGNILKSQQKFEEAVNIYKKTLTINTDLGDKGLNSTLYNNLSFLYIELKDYSLAINYAKLGLEYSLEVNNVLQQVDSYKYLSLAYEKTGKLNEAFNYYKLFNSMKDSLFSVEKSKQLTEMETKYQTEKKQQEIEKQNLELGKQNAEIQKQTILRNSFIASFVLILIIAIVIYRNFRNKKKANIILSQQKVEIQQQKEEIESQRDELQTSNLKLETVNSELEKLSIVASETDNSVVIADKSGEIEWVNEGFTRLFGYTNDEFISINSSNLKKASNNKDIENAIKECINEQKTVTYTTKNKTKSGKSIWTQTTLTPIIKDNTLIKLVAIDSDISKLKQAEEEIKQQKEELQSQSELLIQTNCQLELKNTQITDSIRYAKQIQDAMLPDLSPKPQNSNLKSQDFEFGTWNLEFETFILFNPKDIVSGDFYWFTKTEDYTYIAVADCTGHGVPGAFMSMIGNTLLNEIVAQKKIHNLTQILIKLDEGVNFAINKQQNLETSQEDGMEISICRIDFNKCELQIASTNQSVYIVNKNEFTEIEGGIYSIGGGSFSNKTFETHKIKYSENTIIYLLSDGYQDQFGGENRKKFGSTNLKEFLKSISEKPLAGQKTELENTFISWKGNNKQIDDITVIGFKI